MAEERTYSGVKSGPTVGEKSIANSRQEHHPEDWLRLAYRLGSRTRSKTSKRVMSVMNRADNTVAKILDIMIVKSISIYFENNAGVVVNVKGDEGFGDHVTISNATDSGVAAHSRTAPDNVRVRSASGRICRAPGNPHRGDLHSSF